MENMLDKYMRREVALLKDLLEKDRIISNLKNDRLIAKEAIERYCPTALISSALKWLDQYGK